MMPLNIFQIIVFSKDFFGSLYPNDLFPIEIVIVIYENPTYVLHDESVPPPSSLDLDAIPKSMFKQFTSVGETKHTLFRNGNRGNPSLRSLIATTLS